MSFWIFRLLRASFTRSREKHNSRSWFRTADSVKSKRESGDTPTCRVWLCEDPHGSVVGAVYVHVLRTVAPPTALASIGATGEPRCYFCAERKVNPRIDHLPETGRCAVFREAASTRGSREKRQEEPSRLNRRAPRCGKLRP